MKVNIEFESKDINGDISRTKNFAIMDIRGNAYKLTYVEDLSGGGVKTRSTLFVSPEELRIIRRGELNTDFIYSNNLTHNTNYGTPYGNFPVCIITKSYDFNVVGDIEDETEGFAIYAKATYTLQVGADTPVDMGIKICITKAENVASM